MNEVISPRNVMSSLRFLFFVNYRTKIWRFIPRTSVPFPTLLGLLFFTKFFYSPLWHSVFFITFASPLSPFSKGKGPFVLFPKYPIHHSLFQHPRYTRLQSPTLFVCLGPPSSLCPSLVSTLSCTGGQGPSFSFSSTPYDRRGINPLE